MAITLLPPRVPIVDSQGLPTPEFQRFCLALYGRIGGASGMSNDDLAVDQLFAGATADVASLRAEIEALRLELSSMRSSDAAAGEAAKSADASMAYSMLSGDYQVNWSSPGAIGFYTPNTGRFTTVCAALSVSGSPSMFFGTDSTSGFYSTSAGNIGVAISGTPAMSWGASGTLTSKQITSTVATGSPPLVVSSSTKVANLYVDRAALADNATTANYATSAGTAAGLSSPSTYPAAATDLPTCIALANALRSAAVAKGL